MVVVRGGGDLGSGVAYRLFRAGIRVVVTELPDPLVVRRKVAFAEAVFQRNVQVEGVTAELAQNPQQALVLLQADRIAVLIDPQADCRHILQPLVIVDSRMTKQPPDLPLEAAPLVIGLGPGFVAGVNCHAVVETNRGHSLGRVIWEGPAMADTGIPEAVLYHREERVLRAPATGRLRNKARIGDLLKRGEVVAEVDGQPVLAPFDGVLRGIIHTGRQVNQRLKIADLDPRNDPSYVTRISDKSLAVGGGVLEAVLSRPDIRARLWT
jgi:xanthine dehydrogenase accessory factor